MLVARGIEKSYGRTRVLSNASLTLEAGQVHALLGANGAGKSTLSRIIAGHLRRDAGEMTLRGNTVNFATPRDGLHAGVSIVMQETSLAPDLSVLDNIFLPSFSMPGRLSKRSMRQRADALLARLAQTDALTLDQEARSLSAAQRQLVEIAKALAFDAAVIIFDEPTAALSPSEVERLFSLIDQLRLDGHAIGFVSHRLEEVLTLTDRVTVLRDGRTVAESVPTNTLDQGALIRLMVGRELGSIYSSRPADVHNTNQVVLEAVHLAASPSVKDVSFTLHAGEILGLGGLVGSGRSETVETIFGLRSKTGGHVTLNGKEFVARRPADALKAGIALVPEDRRRQSIIPDFSVAENLMLGHLGVGSGIGPGYRKQGARAAELLTLLDLPADRLSDPDLLNFSGGMQQKIIIARWLLLGPSVLILDEPTKGIDIATRVSIYGMLRKIADKGVAILVISSDFEELLGICERVSVISDGTTIADVPSAFLNEEQLTLLAAPRTSMARTQSFLNSFASEFSGHSFWGLMDAGRLICLADGLCEASARRDFKPGAIVDIENTSISLGLSVPRGTIAESGDSKVIILDVKTARGHGNGVVGLVVHGSTPAPSATTVRERVAAAFDRIGE